MIPINPIKTRITFDRDIEDTRYKGYLGLCPSCGRLDAIFHNLDDKICVDCLQDMVDKLRSKHEKMEST